MIEIPKQRGFVPSDEPGSIALSGRFMARVARLMAPKPEDTRETILKLRTEMAWTRGTMAALLGVSEATLRAWEAGVRQPCMAARKLVWLFAQLVEQQNQSPESHVPLDGVQVVTWGRVGQSSGDDAPAKAA